MTTLIKVLNFKQTEDMLSLQITASYNNLTSDLSTSISGLALYHISVYEKFQVTRAKVAPVNLIYGSHFSATEATL